MNPNTKTPATKLEDIDVITALKNNLINYRTDIAERNTYIDKRDRYLYGDGLFENIEIPDGFDKTMYNWLRRTVEINRDQFVGQPFGIYSHFHTDDISAFKPTEKDQIEQVELSNKMNETRAMGRQSVLRAIIRKNGGNALWKQGKQVGGAYGSTLYQMWWDKDEKEIKIQLLESIQNWYPVWADNNFRERLGDSYVLQIAEEQANHKYGKFLKPGDQWPVSFAGDPLINIQGGTSTLTNQAGETVSSSTTRRPMVTQMNYTGILPGIKYSGKKGDFVTCDYGQETKLSFKVVGNIIVEKTTDPNYMPTLYYIPNHVVPRRPYGESDLVESAMQINQTYIQRMCDLITLANKVTFPMIQAKGFELSGIPRRKQREMTVIPMSHDQALEPVNMPQPLGMEREILEELKAQYMLVTGMPRLVFDEGSVQANSAQALNATMSAMQGIVADCQDNWEPVVCEMLEDALELAGRHDKNVKDLLDDDDSYLYLGWPSSLHKDNPAHQSMLINDLRAGTLSIQSYLEARGVRNVDQEINRLRSNLKDSVLAAIIGGRLGELAQFTIYESLGVPLWGFNTPKISLKGDLTPQQEGNMGANYGWNSPDSPYGASIGPQGTEGTKANQDTINQGFLQGDKYQGLHGYPTGVTPGQAINPSNPQGQGPGGPAMGQGIGTNPGGGTPQAPIATPGQNTPGSQPMSMPGSGATAVTPQGAVNQANQHKGRH
jgi:hypothetical protein